MKIQHFMLISVIVSFFLFASCEQTYDHIYNQTQKHNQTIEETTPFEGCWDWEGSFFEFSGDTFLYNKSIPGKIRGHFTYTPTHITFYPTHVWAYVFETGRDENGWIEYDPSLLNHTNIIPNKTVTYKIVNNSDGGLYLNLQYLPNGFYTGTITNDIYKYGK